MVLLKELGLDLDALSGRRRAFCRPCLDWSERRWHIGGAVGAGLARRLEALGWTRPVPDSRAVELTPDGVSGLRRFFALTRLRS